MMYKIIMYIQLVHVIYSTLMYFCFIYIHNFNDVHRYELGLSEANVFYFLNAAFRNVKICASHILA